MAELTRGERFCDARTVYNQHGKQTMDDVATATRLAKSMIQSLEDDTSQRSVGYDKIITLAQHYGVTTDFLFGLSNDPKPRPSVVDDLCLSVEAVSNIINWKNNISIGNSLNMPSNEYTSLGLSRLLENGDFMLLVADIQMLHNAISSETGILQKYHTASNYSDKLKWELLSDELALESEIVEIVAKVRPEYLGRFSVSAGFHFVESQISAIVSQFEKIVRTVTEYDNYRKNVFGDA